MVESSSTAGVNKAQLVGTHDWKVIVPVYDWSAFLGQYFVKFPGIKKFHYFRFSKEEPGKIYFKEYSTSPERSLLLLKHPATLPPAVLPAKVNPQGLSQERNHYLHREIRQFCKPGTEDLVAPAPWSLWSSIRQCSTKTALLGATAPWFVEVDESRLLNMTLLGATKSVKVNDQHVLSTTVY